MAWGHFVSRHIVLGNMLSQLKKTRQHLVPWGCQRWVSDIVDIVDIVDTVDPVELTLLTVLTL